MPQIISECYPYFPHRVHSISTSDALQVVINLFCEQLQVSIMRGDAEAGVLDLAVSILYHLGPPQTNETRERCFLWLAGVLNSRYPDYQRCRVAQGVIQLIGKQFHYSNPEKFPPSWVPLLLDFLSLCEKLNYTGGFTALQILSSYPPSSDFNTMTLPILTSMLLPTHPLKSRCLVLKIFHNFAAGWFSSQVENIPYKDINNLVQAVGDPLQFTDLPTPDGQVVTVDYKPMMVVILLIEFTSSDLWQNHLCHSNFASSEGILSTGEGRRTALKSMLHMAVYSWPEFLGTPAKIIAAIRCLKKLQCLSMAEAVILWAWTVGVVDAADHNGWGLIEHETLDFYQTHGMNHLASLSQHIPNSNAENMHLTFLLMHYRSPPCRVGSVQQLIPFREARCLQDSRNLEDLCIARACQLRRLYWLFGCYDPMMWKELVGAGEVGLQTDMSPEQSMTPLQFTDWACDYP